MAKEKTGMTITMHGNTWKNGIKKIIYSGVKEVYGYFNNDIGANAVENAKQLKALFN